MTPRTRTAHRPKFRAGEVVRMVSVLDVGLPSYWRIISGAGDNYYLERFADASETYQENGKYLRKLTKRERGA